MNEIPYIKSLSFWFTDEELRSLYQANPLWAQLEQKLYGSLMVHCDDLEDAPESEEMLTAEI